MLLLPHFFQRERECETNAIVSSSSVESRASTRNREFDFERKYSVVECLIIKRARVLARFNSIPSEKNERGKNVKSCEKQWVSRRKRLSEKWRNKSGFDDGFIVPREIPHFSFIINASAALQTPTQIRTNVSWWLGMIYALIRWAAYTKHLFVCAMRRHELNIKSSWEENCVARVMSWSDRQ